MRLLLPTPSEYEFDINYLGPWLARAAALAPSRNPRRTACGGASARGRCASGHPPDQRAGTVEPATPRDVEQRLATGGFVWLDLESLDGERLEEFGRSLQLDAAGIAMPQGTWQAPGLAMLTSGVAQRPSVAAVGVVVQALVPAAGGPAPDTAAIPFASCTPGVPPHLAFQAVPGAGAGASPV